MTEMSKCALCSREWVPSFSLDCYEIDGLDVCERCAMPYFMKSRDPEPVGEERVRSVCMFGDREATCAFLLMSPRFSCAKASPFEDVLRRKLEVGLMTARGDNCSGPPSFKITTTQ